MTHNLDIGESRTLFGRLLSFLLDIAKGTIQGCALAIVIGRFNMVPVYQTVTSFTNDEVNKVSTGEVLGF